MMRYDLLVQKAMRDVVRDVVANIAKEGVLPGDHHFYLTFDTTHADTQMSDRLRDQYPEQMTIVLQHQFWDLKVDDEHIEVGLSFDQIPEHLSIPFEALRGFYDPSVNFGLQFEQSDPGVENSVSEGSALIQLDNDDEKTSDEHKSESNAAKNAEQDEENVISLDQFRKKAD